MSVIAIIGLGVLAMALLVFIQTRDQTIEMPISHPGEAQSVEAFIAAGRKIDAIKLYRDQHDVGLREAKEAVEAMQQRVLSN